MRKNDYIRLADLYKTEIDKLKEELLEAQMSIRELKNEIDHKDRHLRRREIEFDRAMLESKIKNDTLVSAITSKDTEIFIYNGGTYRVRELNLSRAGDKVDTLNLELVKYDAVVTSNGGLIGAMQEAIKNVSNSLKVAFYGDNNDIHNVVENVKK